MFLLCLLLPLSNSCFWSCGPTFPSAYPKKFSVDWLIVQNFFFGLAIEKPFVTFVFCTHFWCDENQKKTRAKPSCFLLLILYGSFPAEIKPAIQYSLDWLIVHTCCWKILANRVFENHKRALASVLSTEKNAQTLQYHLSPLKNTNSRSFFEFSCILCLRKKSEHRRVLLDFVLWSPEKVFSIRVIFFSRSSRTTRAAEIRWVETILGFYWSIRRVHIRGFNDTNTIVWKFAKKGLSCALLKKKRVACLMLVSAEWVSLLRFGFLRYWLGKSAR